MRSLIAIIFIFILTSCMTDSKLARICATCPVTTNTITIIKDSIHVKETIIYDTLYQSVDGPTVVIPGPCDKFCDQYGKLKSFHQEKKVNGIKETINTNTVTNQLEFDCNEDSLRIVNEKKTIEIQEYKNKITEITKQKPPVTTNILTGWQKFMIHSSYIFWLLLLAVAGFKAFKFYKKIKP